MILMLNRLGGLLFDFFGPLSIEWAVLALLVVATLRLLRIQSPMLRHLFWLVLLVKPVVAVAIASPWTIFRPLTSYLGVTWSGSDQALSVWQAGSPGSAVGAAMLPASTPQLTFAGIVVAFWLVGALLLLSRILIGYSVIWKLRRHADLQDDGPIYEAMQSACLAIDVHPRVEVAISDDVNAPIVVGILRPLIIVPADLPQKLRDDEFTMILMHELAHVHRFDNATLFLHRLLAAMLFFHPVVWLCGRMMQREAEQASDDLVFDSTTGHRDHYANSLTVVAEMVSLRNPSKEGVPTMSLYTSIESDLARRIRRTLTERVHRLTPRSRVVALLLLCGMCIVTLPSTGVAQDRPGAPSGDGTKAEQTKDDDVDWRAAMATAPEDWSDELMEQIVAAGYELEDIMEKIRERQALMRDGDDRTKAEQTKDDDVDWRAAMATAPEDWSDELKEQIVAAGYELESIMEKIRERQAQQGGGESLDLVDLQDLGITSTAIEERSWGQLKAEARGGGL